MASISNRSLRLKKPIRRIPAVHVGGIIDLLLAAQQNSGLSSDVAQALAGSVEPVSYTHLDVYKRQVHKASGTSDEVQEEDTTRWADQTSDPLIIQGIADSSAKFATATADGCLYAVFNGISVSYTHLDVYKRQTECCSAAEGGRPEAVFPREQELYLSLIHI